MIAYRKKTRSNEVVYPQDFRPGLIVWVAGSNGREQCICTGENCEPVSLEEWRRRKAERAAERRVLDFPSQRGSGILRDRMYF